MRFRGTFIFIMLLVVLGFVGVPTATAEGPAFHVVRPGDTLWSLSIHYNVTLGSLLRANGLSNPEWIYTGQVLVVPRNIVQQTRYHVVRAGDTVFSISNRYGVSGWALVRQNSIVSNLIYPGQTLVIPTNCCSDNENPKGGLEISTPVPKAASANITPTVAQRRILWMKPYSAGSTGFDISYPQCPHKFPVAPHNFIIVGINGGKAFTDNTCFAAEYDWAARTSTMTPSIYMNLNYVAGSNADKGLNGPAGHCSETNITCQAYNYGYNAAHDAIDSAGSRTGRVWWIDLELENTWSTSDAMNAQVIQGAIDFFQNQGILVGIYSSLDHWSQMVGTFRPRHINQGVLPLWIFLADNLAEAPSFCSSSKAFAGGTPWLVQYPSNGFDGVYVCP